VYGLFIVRDILLPAHDPVRLSTGEDDPGGGVLDGAPDRFSFALGSSTPAVEDSVGLSEPVSGRPG